MIRLKVVKERLAEVESRLVQLEQTKGSIAGNTYDSLKSRYKEEIASMTAQIKQMQADMEKAVVELDMQRSNFQKTVDDLQKKNQENEILKQSGAISSAHYRTTRRNLSGSLRRLETKIKGIERRKKRIMKSADDGSAKFAGSAYYNRETIGEKIRGLIGVKTAVFAVLVVGGAAGFFVYQNRDVILTKYFPEESVQGVVTAKNGLYLRVSPSVDASTMTLMPLDSRVKVIKADAVSRLPEFIMGAVGKWRKIYYQNMTGWAFDGFIDYDRSLASLKEQPARVKAVTRKRISEGNGVAGIEISLFDDGTAAVNMTELLSSKSSVFKGLYVMTGNEIIVQFEKSDYDYTNMFNQYSDNQVSQISPPQVSGSVVRFPLIQDELWMFQVRCTAVKGL